MKRIALVATVALLCLCMAGCASNSAGPSQSGDAVSSTQNTGSSDASSSTDPSDTLSVGDQVDVAGSIIMVTSDVFVVDCSGVHFTCIPADPASVDYVTAGNSVEIEGTISAIQDSAVTLEGVTVKDYSDGYRNFGEHYGHHDESHHNH